MTSLQKVASGVCGAHPAGPRRSRRVGGPQGRWQRNGALGPPAPPAPRQPAPPGPEDAAVYVEFSQTSQKEMYLPGHGPRRWVTAFLDQGVGRRRWERGGCLPKQRGRDPSAACVVEGSRSTMLRGAGRPASRALPPSSPLAEPEPAALPLPLPLGLRLPCILTGLGGTLRD